MFNLTRLLQASKRKIKNVFSDSAEEILKLFKMTMFHQTHPLRFRNFSIENANVIIYKNIYKISDLAT